MKLRLAKVLVIITALILFVPVVSNLDVFDEAADKRVPRILEDAPSVQEPDAAYLQVVEVANTAGNSWTDHYTSCTPRTQQGCMKILKEDLADHPIETGSELQAMLTRYQQTTDTRSLRMANNLSSEIRVPRWGLLLKLAGLNLANSSQAGTDEFIEALDRDTRFWSLFFKEGQTMLEKMVGVAGLWMNAQFASEFAGSTPLTSAETRRMDQILARSRLEPKEIVPAYLTEFRSLAHLISAPYTQEKAASLGLSPWQISWFSQTNATLNSFHHDVFEPIAALAGVPDPEAIQKLSSSAEKTSSGPGKAGATLRIYNPVGKRIVASTRGYSDYLARVHDLNGMLGMVRFKLNQAKNPDIEVREFLEPSLDVSEDQNGLFFTCLDGQSLCRIYL